MRPLLGDLESPIANTFTPAAVCSRSPSHPVPNLPSDFVYTEHFTSPLFRVMPPPILLHSEIKDVVFGTNVKVVQPANLYGCTIGDDCFIGPFVEIQRGVKIGSRCRIQSHAFICELVTIGDDSFVSHGAMFINDRFATGGPARGRRELWRSTNVGRHVSIGTNATILPVNICDHVVIGAGAVVTRDIQQPGIYAGNPARLLSRRPYPT